MATKKGSKIDDAEAQVNFRYSLGIMQQNGDKAGLAKAKKENPALYADWEKRTGAAKKSAPVAKTPAKKTGKK